MKDVKGTHVLAIRNAISKAFGLVLLTSKGQKNSKDILEWKESEEVTKSYNKLYNGKLVIENITSIASPSLIGTTDEKFNDMYIYTASVCDIILNPDNLTLEVSKKSLELRLQKFKVFVDLFCYLK